MEHLLFYDSLEEDFANEDEDIVSDLSGIEFWVIRNIHDRSLEMTVEVFGKDHETPITSDLIYDPETYIPQESIRPTFCPKCLINVFDEKLVDLLVKNSIKISWNKGWASQVVLDPINLHLAQKLEAEDQ
ncbi:MAG: hypothetical protein PF450_06315 [Bacteroidales bacterium]|jgi:hypothetical protein|nr:hypothetical protein [Bacteroidales bacterium]